VSSFRNGSGLVDAPDARMVGTKGKCPFVLIGTPSRDDPRRRPSERRRRSIEVLEESARTLGAALNVTHGEDGTTMQLRLPIYAASE
jgi:hypothetical protein